MSESEALRARRSLLFERLCQAADADSGLPGNLR